MPANERRFWRCIKGHIMGEIKKISVGGSTGYKVRALLLFERSLTCGEADVPAELPPLRITIIGDARSIICTIEGCGHMRDWNIGDDAFEQLMSTRARMYASQV